MDEGAATQGGAIEHRYLRSAIEYAVLMAEETQKRKPPMPVPNALRAFFGKPRVPAGALGRLRRAIEHDDVFRQRIAAGALPELVDEVGRLWLQRPANWAEEAQRSIAESERAAVPAIGALGSPRRCPASPRSPPNAMRWRRRHRRGHRPTPARRRSAVCP